MAIDHLHVLGDIFDRGPNAKLVMDTLMKFHSVDIQIGNHDALWMGATCGNKACIANVIRICSRYDNINTLEDGYGINIRPLTTFALKTYKDDIQTENVGHVVQVGDGIALVHGLKRQCQVSFLYSLMMFMVWYKILKRML